MEMREARLLLKEFTDNATKRDHPFVIVHFSPEADRYECMTYGLDNYDALMAVVEIMHHYKIKPRGAVLTTMKQLLRKMEEEDLQNLIKKN